MLLTTSDAPGIVATMQRIISVRMDAAQADRVDEFRSKLAERNGMTSVSFAEAIRVLLDRGLQDAALIRRAETTSTTPRVRT